MAAVIFNENEFQHILRIMATNVDGRRQIAFALTAIRGCGRRFAFLVCKKADIDPHKRAGELKNEEIDRVINVMTNPREYKIPDYFLNRRRDIEDGTTAQITANQLVATLRTDLARMRKIRCHRGLRHFWGVRVRGQRTKTTGRKGRTMGVSKKRGV